MTQSSSTLHKVQQSHTTASKGLSWGFTLFSTIDALAAGARQPIRIWNESLAFNKRARLNPRVRTARCSLFGLASPTCLHAVGVALVSLAQEAAQRLRVCGAGCVSAHRVRAQGRSAARFQLVRDQETK